MDEMMIGKKIRQLRMIRKISIQKLAEDTGMSYSYLSGLENDKHSISLVNLQRLARYFEIDLIHFLEKSEKKPLRFKNDEQDSFVTDDGIRFKIVTNSDIKNLQATFISLPPNAPSENNVHKHHRGDEFIYVLQGTVEVMVESEKMILKKGEGVIFPAEHEHVIATQSKPAQILLISSPPNGLSSDL